MNNPPRHQHLQFTPPFTLAGLAIAITGLASAALFTLAVDRPYAPMIVVGLVFTVLGLLLASPIKVDCHRSDCWPIAATAGND